MSTARQRLRAYIILRVIGCLVQSPVSSGSAAIIPTDLQASEVAGIESVDKGVALSIHHDPVPMASFRIVKASLQSEKDRSGQDGFSKTSEALR